jgi:DNA-binding CsgD family transcriptional regulator
MLEDLTPREREFFDLLLKGTSAKEIANELNISISTVDFHRTNIYKKLGINNIKEVFVKYSNYGKSAPPEPGIALPVSESKKQKRSNLFFSVRIALGIILLVFSMFFIFINIRKSFGNPEPKNVIIPFNNMGFYATAASDIGGNSTSEVFITLEEIDGVNTDVLNIKINLIDESGDVYASACTNKPDLIQRLRQANGIRFKARGDGKTWAVQFQTAETTEERHYASYSYIAGTARDQVIAVDIPYSSLFLPEWYENSFDFNKETIRTLLITANRIHGYGQSLLQIFDFEIY